VFLRGDSRVDLDRELLRVVDVERLPKTRDEAAELLRRERRRRPATEVDEFATPPRTEVVADDPDLTTEGLEVRLTDRLVARRHDEAAAIVTASIAERHVNVDSDLASRVEIGEIGAMRRRIDRIREAVRWGKTRVPWGFSPESLEKPSSFHHPSLPYEIRIREDVPKRANSSPDDARSEDTENEPFSRRSRGFAVRSFPPVRGFLPTRTDAETVASRETQTSARLAPYVQLPG